VAGGAGNHADRALEQIEGAIEPRVVASVLDHAARMGDGGAIALEQIADLGERKLASNMRQIHRGLAGECDPRRASARLPQSRGRNHEGVERIFQPHQRTFKPRTARLRGFARNRKTQLQRQIGRGLFRTQTGKQLLRALHRGIFLLATSALCHVARECAHLRPAHPAIELIKMKDWILDTSLDASLGTTPRLYREIVDRFRVMAPLIGFLNRPLLARKPSKDLLEFRF